MIRKAIYSIVMASLLTFSSSADTVILQDTPNPGDTTTTVTTSTTTSHTTNNLLSQDFTDGSWEGPNQDTRHGSGTIAGIGGEYVQSTITQSDTGLTNEQIQRGFTSTLGANIWFWDTTDNNQSVTMTQTYDDKLGTVTTQNKVVNYVSTGYNTYTDTITVGPNLSTQGELTAKYGFTHTNTTSHRAADLKLPTLTLGYTNVTTSSTTSVEYCWQKSPPTCPAQEEIAEVETILETFEDDLEDLYLDDIYVYEEDYFIPEELTFEYSFNNELFEDEIEIEEDYLTFDEFFFEEQYFDDDFYEEFELEEFYPEDMAFEEIEYFDELPEMTFEDEYFEEFDMAEMPMMFEELPPLEEVFFEDTMFMEEEMFFEEEMFIEAFTDEAFIEEFDEMFEDMPMEEFDMEMAEEMFEEVFEEYFEEEPPMEMVEEIIEEPIEEDIIEEEPMDESPMETVASVDNEPQTEEPDEVEEQPSSESPIADEPEETTDVAEQEEADEEPTELAVAQGSPTKEPDPVSEDVQGEPELETELDVKLAAIENVIKSQIKNTVQRTTATLNVINEIVSREMISQQPDMSSYFNMNAALFDTRQLPSGNPAFFNQISLDTYDYTIYNDQVAMVTNMVGQDPVVQHEKKMRDINNRKTKVLIELKEMLNARSNE